MQHVNNFNFFCFRTCKEGIGIINCLRFTGPSLLVQDHVHPHDHVYEAVPHAPYHVTVFVTAGAQVPLPGDVQHGVHAERVGVVLGLPPHLSLVIPDQAV